MIYSISQFFLFVAPIAVAILGIFFLPADTWLYIILASLVACGLIILSFYLLSKSVKFTVTNQRVRVRRGLLSQVEENLEMFRMDHFELRRPLALRLLGFASLHLFSSDIEFNNFRIYAVPNLEALAEEMRECQLRERVRRGLTTFVKA